MGGEDPRSEGAEGGKERETSIVGKERNSGLGSLGLDATEFAFRSGKGRQGPRHPGSPGPRRVAASLSHLGDRR